MLQNSLSRSRSLLLTCALAAWGCGTGAESVSVEPPPPTPVKAMLDEVAATGELGSAAESIREGLNALKTTDAAKADALLTELAELEQMQDPEQIKTKAKAMADQL
jgi:hypothetical protein